MEIGDGLAERTDNPVGVLMLTRSLRAAALMLLLGGLVAGCAATTDPPSNETSTSATLNARGRT